MSDVREASAPTMSQQNRTGPNPTGDYIWYELMTTDAEGAKDFYDAVVGWDFGKGEAEYNGYRMINTRDGAFAGGVMPITDEMYKVLYENERAPIALQRLMTRALKSESA